MDAENAADEVGVKGRRCPIEGVFGREAETWKVGRGIWEVLAVARCREGVPNAGADNGVLGLKANGDASNGSSEVTDTFEDRNPSSALKRGTGI